MKLRTHYKSILPTVSIGALLALSALVSHLAAATKLDADQTKAAVTVLTAKILEGSQFAHHQLDDPLAAKFLNRYLDTLDSEHLIFLQSDVDEFAHFTQEITGAMRQSGDTTPAQVIFQRYLKRLDERAAFVADLLKKERFEFTSNEQYRYDRKDAPYPRDLAAAQALWRQRLRSEYLQEKLAGKEESGIAKTLANRSNRLVQTMRKLGGDTVTEFYLNALAHVYDPHSDYMGREEYATFNIGMNLSLAGIGATLQSVDGYCKIRQLVPGGPAARSGLLRSGDRIVGASRGEGKEMVDLVDMPLNQAVDLIRGPKGSTVHLSILPAGDVDSAVRKTVTIVRDEIKLEDQQAKARIVDLPSESGKSGKTERIGVIDLPAFYSSRVGGEKSGTSATADVVKLISKLKQEKITGLILDLRRNGGGSLEEAINLTGLFIPKGPVVQTRTLEGHIEVGADQDDSTLYDGPMVVLTSRLSASASEILAGALQDYGRALIVGDAATFGKGTVQTVIPLGEVLKRQGLTPSADPGALKVTISKFYRPSGKSTQLAGVASDIVLPSLTDTPEIGEAELGNPLPWDTIPAASFPVHDLVQPYLADLRALSAKRIAKDTGFAALQEDRARFQKDRETKSISLNEATRRQEIADNKARMAARKKERAANPVARAVTYEITLKNIGRSGLGDPVKASQDADKNTPESDSATAGSPDDEAETPKTADDIVLREAEHILTDYSHLLPRQKEANVTQR